MNGKQKARLTDGMGGGFLYFFFFSQDNNFSFACLYSFGVLFITLFGCGFFVPLPQVRAQLLVVTELQCCQ